MPGDPEAPEGVVDTVDTAEGAEAEDTENQSNATADEGEDGEAGEQQQAAADPDEELEEVERNGKKFKVSKGLRGELMAQADYSRNIQALKQAQREFQQEREQRLQALDTTASTYSEAKVNLKALEDTVAEYRKVNWDALKQSDPDAYDTHWRQYTLAEHQRTEARDQVTAQERLLNEERNRLAGESDANRQAALAQGAQLLATDPVVKLNPDRYAQLRGHATSKGFSEAEVLEAVADPRMMRVLAENHDSAVELKATKAKLAAYEKANNVAGVAPIKGANGGGQTRSTKDPDKMTTPEWMAWEDDRLKKAGSRQPNGQWGRADASR